MNSLLPLKLKKALRPLIPKSSPPNLVTIQYIRNEHGTMANRIRLQRKQQTEQQLIKPHLQFTNTKCINCFPFQFSCSFAE